MYLCAYVLVYKISLNHLQMCIFLKWYILKYSSTRYYWASQVALTVKNSPAHAGDAGDLGLIPRLGRSSGKGNGPTPVILA